MKFILKSESGYENPESYLKDFGCFRISRYLEIHTTGDITICCHSWLPEFCGNILTDNIEDILNNSNRLSMIKDMDNGEFTNCNDHCPFISAMLSGKQESVNFIVPLHALPFYKKNKPLVINFSYDQSCNLQCPSCRDSLILHKVGENEQLVNVHAGVEKLVNYLLSQGENVVLNITGSGDAFASPTYWQYLKTLSAKNPGANLQIKLMTNGILMTETRWNEIKPLWNNITHIGVSIDAYTNETYSKIRVNGSKATLDKNLKVLNELIKNNSFVRLTGWQTNYTVQKDNYKELIDYVNWQLSYDQLSTIFFNCIDQWGHLNDVTFNRLNINQEDKLLLKEILSNDIFNNKKVMLGNLNSFR